MKLCLFMFRSITLKQLTGLIPGSGKDYICLSVLLLCFNFFYTKFCNSFCNVSSFSILNILQMVYKGIKKQT